MKDLTNIFEIEKYKEELKEHRLKEQKDKNDYAYLEDGSIEKCICGMPLNSHDHCPRCDY